MRPSRAREPVEAPGGERGPAPTGPPHVRERGGGSGGPGRGTAGRAGLGSPVRGAEKPFPDLRALPARTPVTRAAPLPSISLAAGEGPAGAEPPSCRAACSRAIASPKCPSSPGCPSLESVGNYMHILARSLRASFCGLPSVGRRLSPRPRVFLHVCKRRRSVNVPPEHTRLHVCAGMHM